MPKIPNGKAKTAPFGGKIILHHIYYIIFFIKNQIKMRESSLLCHDFLRKRKRFHAFIFVFARANKS